MAASIGAACSGGSDDTEAQPSVSDPTALAQQAATAVAEAEAAPPTPSPTPAPENAIKVGVLLDVGSVTGEVRDPGNVMSPLDRPAAIAFEAAVDAINDSGGLLGRPVTLLKADTTSRLSVIDRESKRMIEAGVELLVVTCEFDFARPAIERAEEAGVLVISPCAGETGWATGDAGALAFSMVPSPDTYGRAMANYVWDQGFRNVSVVSDATAPEASEECDAFRSEWSELGGSLAYSQAFSLRAAERLDETPQIGAIGNGDAIVVCAFKIIGIELMLQMRLLDFKMPMFASPSLDTGNWLPLDIATAAEGAADLGEFRLFSLASVWGDDPSPRMAPAIDQYISAQAIPPNSGRFVVGSDLAQVWSTAVTETGTTEADAVARAIRAMNDVDVVSGTLSFRGSQAPVARDLRVLRHQNGTYVFEALVTATK